MGRFDYEAARHIFEALHREYPDDPDLAVNLAIATLNRNQEGDTKAALALAEAVLEKHPDHLRARYVAGLLRLYEGDAATAAEHFRKVVEADPEDAHAAYYLGQALAQTGDTEAAVAAYRRAIEHDPYLRSAYYGAFQGLRKLRRVEEARALIQTYQRLAKNPRAHLAEFKYTRMGRKAEALAVGRESTPTAPPPEGPLFAEARTLGARAPALPEDGRGALNVADLDGDGDLDVFVAGREHGRVLLGDGAGGFTPAEDHPLATVPHVLAAAFGDYDNDGRTDAYLLRRGPNRLFRRTESGWEDVTQTTGTDAGERESVDGLFLDADHDGDLDIWVAQADGPDALLNNNGDGTFRDIAVDRGIAGERPTRGLLPVDLDRDRDVDLVRLADQPPHPVHRNDRLWNWQPVADWRGFREHAALAVTSGDLDADGWPELYTLALDGRILRWTARSRDPHTMARLDAPRGEFASLTALDADGDGILDLLAATATGWWVVDAGGTTRFTARPTPGRSFAALTPILLEPARGYAVLAQEHDGSLRLWPAGPGRHPFVALAFTGREDTANAMRSNASGLGVQVALRVGARWTLADTWRPTPGPGQGLQPLALGLDGAARADFVALEWSDGVFQTEMALPAGLHRIAETQRQLSSCPVLFAWNGERYAFVSDLLGVGGVGYAIGPGQYAEPRPWEYFLLPEGALAPRDGALILKVHEPMEEAVYLDQARLHVYDLPPGWRIVMDERMGTGAPPVTGRPIFYRAEWLPAAAHNDRGEDVLETVLRADGRAAPVGEKDRRFIGRLAREHALTLTFERPLDRGPGRPVLVIDGWVEYPYSQTHFAAWQAGAKFHPPSLDVQTADGRWLTLYPEFGYPAGMPRRMALPLGELPPDTRTLRLRTNLEIYWDRIAVAFEEEPPADLAHRVLAVSHARLAKPGFPQRRVHAQNRPEFRYALRQPFWDTRYMAGWYTRLGPVTELVARHDDAVAVFGPGEEVELRFRAPHRPVPEGWTRRYVLEARGWAKDMDLFTRDGETVAPLPRSGKDPDHAAALHARYNLRYLAGP
jgi:tetratricopeptide (TPR) repeat protein